MTSRSSTSSLSSSSLHSECLEMHIGPDPTSSHISDGGKNCVQIVYWLKLRILLNGCFIWSISARNANLLLFSKKCIFLIWMFAIIHSMHSYMLSVLKSAPCRQLISAWFWIILCSLFWVIILDIASVIFLWTNLWLDKALANPSLRSLVRHLILTMTLHLTWVHRL